MTNHQSKMPRYTQYPPLKAFSLISDIHACSMHVCPQCTPYSLPGELDHAATYCHKLHLFLLQLQNGLDIYFENTK